MEGAFIDTMGYPKICRGIVVSTDDPKHLCRCKVRIPMVYGDPNTNDFIPDEQLPWASVMGFGITANAGIIAIPPVGTTVMVMFEEGDISRPIVLGSVCVPRNGYPIQDINGNIPEGSDTSFPDVYTNDSVSKALEIKRGDYTISIKSDELLISDNQGRKIQIKSDNISIGTFNNGSLDNGVSIENGKIYTYANRSKKLQIDSDRVYYVGGNDLTVGKSTYLNTAIRFTDSSIQFIENNSVVGFIRGNTIYGFTINPTISFKHTLTFTGEYEGKQIEIHLEITTHDEYSYEGLCWDEIEEVWNYVGPATGIYDIEGRADSIVYIETHDSGALWQSEAYFDVEHTMYETFDASQLFVDIDIVEDA